MDLESLSDKGVLDRDKHYVGKCIAYDKRFLFATEARRDLDVVLLEAEALWGADIKALVKPLYDKSWKLYAYIETHLMSIDPSQDSDYREAYAEVIGSQPNIMYRRNGVNEDQFSLELNEYLLTVEVYLRSKLA